MASENRPMQYHEELVVPIIENTPFEHDLSDSMAQVKGGWGERERDFNINLKIALIK